MDNVWYSIPMDFDQFKPRLKSIAEKYGIDMLVLFGSQANGKTHPKSDVDIGYTAGEHFDFSEQLSVLGEIQEVLKREDVEFVNMRRVSPLMKKVMADEGVLLYEQVPGTFISFKIYAFKLYIETKFLRDLRYQSLKKFVYGTSR